MRTMIIAGLAVAALAVAAGAGIEHTMLHGAQVGEVRVWIGPSKVPALTEESLEALVEARLEEAGIELSPASPAVLYVVVTAVADSTFFATLESSLVEEARLERNGLRVQAESWHGGAIVSAASEREWAQAINEATSRMVGDFVAMHEAMNPRSES